MIRSRGVFAVLCLALLSALPAFARKAPAETQPPVLSAQQLDALSGEYTSSSEPDTSLSFYVEDGKLVVESDHRIPQELKACFCS